MPQTIEYPISVAKPRLQAILNNLESGKYPGEEYIRSTVFYAFEELKIRPDVQKDILKQIDSSEFPPSFHTLIAVAQTLLDCYDYI